MPRRIYPNPPIDEATCQFTPADPLPWESATPGRLFELLKAHYPGMPSQQQLLQANLIVAAAGAPAPNFALASNDRIVFVNEDGTNRLSVSPINISVHRAKPYAGFKRELLARIRRDLPQVIDLLDQNDSFKAISVRYVNRIVIPEETFSLADYFNHWGAANGLPSPFDGPMSGFFYRTAVKSTNEPDDLTLTFGSLDASDNQSAFLLDMDLVHNFDEPVKADEAIERMISIQALANSIFESLITEKCRELFE